MAAAAAPRELLELLEKTVPANTLVTLSSEINLLESLGVVSDQRAVSAMRTASLLIPPDAPATFRGLMGLLGGLIRMNPKFSDEHKEALDKALGAANQVDDFQLTFGTCLGICGKLMEAKGHRTSHHRNKR